MADGWMADGYGWMDDRIDHWPLPSAISHDGLLKIPAPLEPVLRSQDAPHADAVILDGAARVAGDDDVIARLQRVARDAGQLPGGGPLDGPALHLALRVRRLHVNERVRVAEHELHHVAFDLDLLVDDVGGGERMVRVDHGARHERGADQRER